MFSPAPFAPIILQNQSEVLAFVIKLILDVPVISHRFLTPSLFCWVKLREEFFSLTDLYYLDLSDISLYVFPFKVDRF